MKKRVGLVILLSLLLGLLAAPMATAGDVKLNAPDYAWWYGCTATSAGMMMGYYDRNGYGGLFYSNLVPGGVAELETFVGPPTGAAALANNAIASAGHIADFYKTPPGYGGSGDDNPLPWHAFNCLADFMGTNQDAAGNSNGSTTLWMRKDGGKTYVSTVFGWGPATYNSDGMYGMWEYLVYAGYSANKDPSIETNLFTQKTDNTISAGFHFSEFKAEIDAGRPVLVHVTDHTMLGYGYNDNNFNAPSIYVHDTWALGGGSMLWGGSYSNLDLWGVTCMTPTGGVVPLPPSVILLGSGLLGVLWGRKRFTQR